MKKILTICGSPRKGNFDDILKNKLNPNIDKELEKIAGKII